MKKIIGVIIASAMIAALAGCQKAQESGSVNFTELELGASKTDVNAKLGSEGTSSGSTPERLTYLGPCMFDFVDKGENTKLTVFLNTEEKAYAYAYYMYDALEQNYADVKKFFEDKYGAATEGENSSEQWKDGDTTYSLNKQGDYIAIGKF